MDAGIIISSLIEKSKIDSTRVQTMIGKHLRRLLKEFLITDAEDNQVFLQGHSTSEQKMARLLQAVYSAKDCIDTWLTRRELKKMRRKLCQRSSSLFFYGMDNLRRFETEREEFLKEREELLGETEELLRESKELQLQRGSVKNCRKRVENCIKTVENDRKTVENDRNTVETLRQITEIESTHRMMNEFQKRREQWQRARESLQSDREKLQKRRKKLKKARGSLQSDGDKIFKQPSTGEMKELENEVKGLCCQIENEGDFGYSFQTNIENYRAWQRISDFCLKDETDVVGVEQQTEELLARLIPETHGNDGGQSAQVIGVVGEGGSGKTTLARSVYNRVDVKQHFTQRAWVHASGVLKSRDVFVDILNQIHPDGFFLEVTISDEEVMFKLKEVMFKLTQLLEDTRLSYCH